MKLVKKYFKKEIITPGIRFDKKIMIKKRVMTPRDAFINGSDWICNWKTNNKRQYKKNLQSLIDHLMND